MNVDMGRGDYPGLAFKAMAVIVAEMDVAKSHGQGVLSSVFVLARHLF